MTYGEVKDAALMLLNGYSIAGTEIAPSYNNQADYLAKIPMLVDNGQMYIATTAKKIPARIALSELGTAEGSVKLSIGKMYLYELPKDCWQMPTTGLMVFDEDGFHRCAGAKITGRNSFILPKDVTGEIYVEYYRYPTLLGPSPAEDAELDNVPEVHAILPYYVAAQLVLYDDNAESVYFHNEFETRLARLAEAVKAEVWPIDDVYGGGDYDGY